MHAGKTNQTTSTQNLLSPNALALAPTTITKIKQENLSTAIKIYTEVNLVKKSHQKIMQQR
jgi:hypothetical protein